MNSVIFFFKQKTAYELRISDWSSDVCSSDLVRADGFDRRGDLGHEHHRRDFAAMAPGFAARDDPDVDPRANLRQRMVARPDRKSVVEGKSVSVRVVLGGRRSINKQNKTNHKTN